jgi:hypothetical protein
MSKAQGNARCLGWGVDKQLQEACLLWKRALEAILVLLGETGWVVALKQLDQWVGVISRVWGLEGGGRDSAETRVETNCLNLSV